MEITEKECERERENNNLGQMPHTSLARPANTVSNYRCIDENEALCGLFCHVMLPPMTRHFVLFTIFPVFDYDFIITRDSNWNFNELISHARPSNTHCGISIEQSGVSPSMYLFNSIRWTIYKYALFVLIMRSFFNYVVPGDDLSRPSLRAHTHTHTYTNPSSAI